MDYAKVFETMVNETQKYLENNNLFAMILGISGGLDSTVTAVICHEVEKRNPELKFYGVSLPCTSNTIDENNSANACMKAFCKREQYWTENLQKEYMLMKSTCTLHHSPTTIGIGNIKARLRMIYLYDLANYTKGLVMDTDNFVPFTSDTGYSMAEADGHNVKLGSFKQLSLIDKNANEEVKNINFKAGRSVAVLIDDKFAGVFILQDKVRSDSKAALAELKKRGVRPIMLTGDNQKTAAAVAEQVDLTGEVISIHDFNDNTDIDNLAGIADVLPEDKLNMVKCFQKKGYIVGMTGDGVNDSPALKQAEVGIAVSNAADVAKRSGKMVLLNDGLGSIVKILDAGHRVYQRMTTWSLTKLARTAELTMLLTFGYLFFDYIPMALNAMVIYTIMNNMVTMMIGTDRTHITYKPENWNMAKLAKIAFSLAAGWTVIGFIFVWYLNTHGWSHGAISTMVYVYLVLSAMLIVLITRTRKYFWQDYPSKLVGIVQIADVALTFILALCGLAMVQISWQNLLITVVVAVIAAVLIDLVYQPVMKNR